MLRALLVSMLLVATAGACSSTTTGTVSTTCPEDGGCQPKPVFATGVLSTFLVTTDSIYAGDIAGDVFAADKPLRASRSLARGSDSERNVAAFVRTSRGLYWFTSPPRSQTTHEPKSSLFWFPADATEPVLIASELPRPIGMAAVGDVVYLAATDHLLALSPGDTALRPVLDVAAYGLRSHGESLYFHDGLSKISSWRMGDKQPEVLVRDAILDWMPSTQVSGRLTYAPDPLVVDDSGLYWFESQGLGGGALAHAPLGGGPREAAITIAADVVNSLSVDDQFIYWSQAAFIASTSTIHRAAKSALANSDVVLGSLVGDATSVQATPEGLYIAASPSLTDFDVSSLGFKRYGGPLLIIPRAMLDAR
jgi:hypothetical protein